VGALPAHAEKMCDFDEAESASRSQASSTYRGGRFIYPDSITACARQSFSSSRISTSAII
jgi:hypothetical protein